MSDNNDQVVYSLENGDNDQEQNPVQNLLLLFNDVADDDNNRNLLSPLEPLVFI
jgi:hypothetical protein